MRKLKFSILVVAMLVVATVAHAQVDLGIKAGVNMSNVYGKNVDNNDMKIGFHAGLSADFYFTPEVALQSGLLVSTKGFTYKTSALEFTSNPIYLQLPVHLAYKVEVVPGTRIVFHGGPYAAYGIAGKHTVKVGSLGSGSIDVFGDSAAQLKRFDFGAGLGVGAEFGQIALDLGWDMGLIDLSNSSEGTLKNQNAYLSVGYKF